MVDVPLFVLSASTPRQRHTGLTVRIVEAISCGLDRALEQVAVAIKRHRDRGVTETGLDHFRVLALCDEEAAWVWRRS